jgi:hypothetical protein
VISGADVAPRSADSPTPVGASSASGTGRPTGKNFWPSTDADALVEAADEADESRWSAGEVSRHGDLLMVCLTGKSLVFQWSEKEHPRNEYDRIFNRN